MDQFVHYAERMQRKKGRARAEALLHFGEGGVMAAGLLLSHCALARSRAQVFIRTPRTAFHVLARGRGSTALYEHYHAGGVRFRARLYGSKLCGGRESGALCRHSPSPHPF